MIKNVEENEYELDPTTWGFQIQKRVNAAKQDNQPNLVFERFVRFFQSLEPKSHEIRFPPRFCHGKHKS